MTNQSRERAISVEVVVAAGLDDVWEAWTTDAGVTSFFAPAANVEARPGGRYEIFFNPDAAPGSRGAEGMRVLAVQPGRLLAFTWNTPPSLPEVRDQQTHVVVRLQAVDEQRTKVALWHDGWGEGGQWDEAFDYFTQAWKQIVLPRLKYRFAEGPVNWAAHPDLAAYR